MHRLVYIDYIIGAKFTRANPPRTGIPLSVQAAMASVIGPLPQLALPNVPSHSGKGKRNRCSFCPRTKDAKYSTKCASCSSYICLEHTKSSVITCFNCNE